MRRVASPVAKAFSLLSFGILLSFAAGLASAQAAATPTSLSNAGQSVRSDSSDSATQLATRAANYPAPAEADYTLSNFKFASGESLPTVKLHYRTVGTPRKGADGSITNAILLLHSTSGSSEQFLNDRFAAQAFNAGQPFDSAKWFTIIPDSIGHGKSSKPSDGLHGKFPHYNYDDMVRAQHQLVTDGLKIQHLKLVIGMSMGCMHAWVWAETYPDMMDGVMPLACLPVEIAGRNRMWRKLAYDSIVKDHSYNNGDYAKQPPDLATALGLMQLVGSNPILRQKQLPTRQSVDAFLDRSDDVTRPGVIDANDLAWALDCSNGYNPQPKLGTIKAKVLAINFADDLINPPELGILESEIKNVPHGRAVVVPLSDKTVGHGTHTSLLVWKNYLEDFMRELPQ